MSGLPSCVAAPKRMEGVTRLFCRSMAAGLAGEGEHEMEVNALERLSATLLDPLGVGGELALGAVAAVAAAAALLDGRHHALLEVAQGPLVALAEDVGDFEERLLQSASCPARRRLSRHAVAPGSLRRCRMRGHAGLRTHCATTKPGRLPGQRSPFRCGSPPDPHRDLSTRWTGEATLSATDNRDSRPPCRKATSTA